MCGIAGQVSFTAPPPKRHVSDLTDRMAHRGPDDHGIWSSPDGACVFGHARLSIIDLSPSGHQPMLDPETGNSIVFNGEIYNFQSLRHACESQGDRFRSHTDTEVILALYRRHGINCLHQLRGMFAFTIWDAANRRVFLARDRIGKKPLNYALTPEGLVFCSEIDPLIRHPAVDRSMDQEALELYLQLQYIPAPWTIYQSVRKLPPAHYAVWDGGSVHIERYWNVDYRRKIRITEDDALDGLEEKLTEAVRLRMISDVPLGALVSGGVDSSVVVALMAKLSPEPVQTFSIGFREEAFNELPYAEQAAVACGADYRPEIIEPDVASLLPTLARHYGEPFADCSAVPSFIVSRVARRHVTVVMNGDGGDELLGGYPRYALSTLAMRTSSRVPDLVPPRYLAALAMRLASVRSLPARAFRKLLLEYGWPELRSLLMYSAFWDDDERRKLLGQETPSRVLPAWRTEYLSGAMAHADTAVERMLWYDNRTYLPGDLLVKIDIASMHCGLEARSPLLDHELVEFCAALPVSYKVQNGTGKYLLKRLAERFFPPEFVHRPKMGFAIPVAEWLRGPLRPQLEEILRDKTLMFPLNQRLIENMLNEFLHQDIAHEHRMWSLLIYGFWRQHATSASPPGTPS